MNDKKHSDKYSVKEFVKKFGFDNCVLELLNFIEKDNKTIKDIIINKYLEKTISEVQEEELFNYFINNSVFSAATAANPATSVVTEFLYTKPKQISFIDNYFLKSQGGDAIYSRFKHVEKNIHQLIEERSKKGKILIGNFGGGPSRDISNIFSKYYHDNNNILAINIDKDKTAIKRGQRIAKILNVEDKIKFLETSFMRYKPKEKFDIIILVGVLCGLPSESCVMVLKKIYKCLKENGCVIASNATPKMLEKDPFTYFIMDKITNWKLVFKKEETLKEIFKKSGFNWERSFTDDYGFHCMGIGKKNKSFFNMF